LNHFRKFFVEKEKKQLGSIWIEGGRRGEGRGVEGNKVELLKIG